MRHFRFKLESVRRLRESVRDQRRGELAQAEQALKLLEQERLTIQAEIKQTERDRARAMRPGPVNVDQVLAGQRYQWTLTSQLRELELKRQQVQEEAERRRNLLLEADRDVRVLDKLEAKQRQEHDQRLRKMDARAMDELAVQRSLRHSLSLEKEHG